MWEHEILRPDEWRRQPVRFAHQKVDGHHLAIFKQPHGQVHALTTTGLDIAGTLRDSAFYPALVRAVPSHTSIMAELHVPDQRASQVRSALAHDRGKLELGVFAVPVCGGADLALCPLGWVSDLVTSWGLNFVPFEELDAMPTASQLLTHAKELGVEGWVLKQHNYQGWWKLKVERTMDVIVTGLKDGDGRNLGLIGSLQCSVSGPGGLVEVASVGTGFSDLERVDLDTWCLGKVCEVRYQYVGDKGRLRHPRFLRWRDDKDPARCGIEQDPDLEEILQCNAQHAKPTQ